jgi:hypothetical protein
MLEDFQYKKGRGGGTKPTSITRGVLLFCSGYRQVFLNSMMMAPRVLILASVHKTIHMEHPAYGTALVYGTKT